MKLDDLNIHDIGNTIQISGVLYEGQDKVFLCFFDLGKVREYDADGVDPHVLDMDLDDWARFLRQSDLLETEVLAQAKDGKITKAILRKCQRQIAQRVSWSVYKRDHYTCRYCGDDSVPLTVDHLVLWEEGGPSTEDNLVASCKKCNSKRGNLQLEDWFDHPYYRKKSRNLPPHVRELNRDLLNILPNIPRRIHKTGR